jgi:FixJ family two-component response regulator
VVRIAALVGRDRAASLLSRIVAPLRRFVVVARQTCIAVIENDPSVRRALGRLLKAMGFHVLTFASAESFVRRGLAHGFDCLLVDVHLKGMTGPRLVTKLTEMGRAVPTIYLSADPDAGVLIRSETGAAGSLLLKPVEENQLRSMLWEVLGTDDRPEAGGLPPQ